MSLKALDLFCGAGGASMGLKEAGFKVVGVDINNQPEYPFEFIKSDVFDLHTKFFEQFQFIWASPPCQAYSFGTEVWRNLGRKYPDLILKTRKMLKYFLLSNAIFPRKRAIVIENLTRAPIRKDLMLCGTMFNLKVLKHRAFEIEGFTTTQLVHKRHRGTVRNGNYVTVAGHGGDGKASLKVWQKAIGIDWITDKKMLAEAIPPAYSEYIGRQFLCNNHGSNLAKRNNLLNKV